MKNIEDTIQKIFQENGFCKKNIFFYKDGGYFAIYFCEKDDIKNFFENKKVGQIIKIRDEFAKSDRNILKNLSLIICLKLDTIQDFEVYKNFILKIEEDEYFFRKYVLVYDQNGESELLNKINGENFLKKLDNLLNEIDFKKFQESVYESSLNWLVVQLFVKLPFLKIVVENEEFQNLEEDITQMINKKNLKTLDDFILYFNDVEIDKNEFLDLKSEKIQNFFKNLNDSLGK